MSVVTFSVAMDMFLRIAPGRGELAEGLRGVGFAQIVVLKLSCIAKQK